MKNLKHYFFLSLSIALILSLSACQKKEEDPSSVPDIPESSVAQMESKEPSQTEASKESDSNQESKESLPKEETSPSQESTEVSKESETEPSKEEVKEDPSKDAKEEEKDLTQAKATPAPTPTASPGTKPTTTPSEKPSASPSVKPSEAPTPAPTQTPESTPAPTSTPAPANSPENTPAPTQAPTPASTPESTPAPTATPAPAQSPEHQHNWEVQYVIRLDYLGNCMNDQVLMMICYGCMETYEEHTTVKIHHQWFETEVIDEDVLPTCTEPGRGGCSIDHNYCDCGERNIDTVYDNRDQTIPPFGHDSAEYTIKSYTGEVKLDENGVPLSRWVKYCHCGLLLDEGWDY